MSSLGYGYFYLCGLIAVLGALGTVIAKNPIRGAMGLLVMILAIAGLFLALHAQFLAAIQLIVYAGAVIVLFLFVIMLLGPRAATLWGIATAALGTVVLGVAGELHTIALGYAIASLGFGLFRPGTTAGTSLAVSRAEQGQASGIVASLAGSSYIYAPALGVWLYGQSPWLGFGLIVALCAAALAHGWFALQADRDLTQERG